MVGSVSLLPAGLRQTIGALPCKLRMMGEAPHLQTCASRRPPTCRLGPAAAALRSPTTSTASSSIVAVPNLGALLAPQQRRKQHERGAIRAAGLPPGRAHELRRLAPTRKGGAAKGARRSPETALFLCVARACFGVVGVECGGPTREGQLVVCGCDGRVEARTSRHVYEPMRRACSPSMVCGTRERRARGGGLC